MDLKRYIYPLRRWWWLLLAATVIAALASLIISLGQPPVYQASTTLMIGRAIEDPNPVANQFWLAQQLTSAYADIANREKVRTATMEALGVTWLPSYQATALPNTQLIEIAVIDTNPQRAQLVAAELANQLILQSPTAAGPEDQNRRNFITEQLDTLQVQIRETQGEIAKLQDELGNLLSARQINDTQNQISALQAKLTTLTGNYANLLSNTQSGAVNTLSVVEPASLPKQPIGPARTMAVLVAALLGFVLAAGAAYLLEFVDDTLKSPQEIERIFNRPLIGYLSELDEATHADSAGMPFVARYPRHPLAEAFRTLRTNLEFAAVDQPLKTLLITSADAEEGKTSVAANLAVVISQSDKKVVLLDADLRNGRLHEVMSLPNDSGLSDVFRGRLSLQSAMRLWKNEKVAFVPSGPTPPNPAELLGSKKMDSMLVSLKEVADQVIIDGPPFIVSDAAVLSAKVDGVIVVVRPGYTRRGAAQAMHEQLARAGARVVGVVVNRIPRRMQAYYGGQLSLYPYYGYGSSRYFDGPAPTPLTGWRGLLAQLQGRALDRISGKRATVKPSPEVESAPASSKRSGD
jgi:non-specific protein-tyrosine kinase